MDISYSIYEQGNDVLLAACDMDLLGETFEEGDIHLDVKESFYGGEDIDREGLQDRFEGITVANLVGEKTVNTAIDYGLGLKEDIMRVEDIPHLQIVRM